MSDSTAIHSIQPKSTRIRTRLDKKLHLTNSNIVKTAESEIIQEDALSIFEDENLENEDDAMEEYQQEPASAVIVQESQSTLKTPGRRTSRRRSPSNVSII
jgi:hypothetical protein